MKNLKIVFYGTPDFAVATLQALKENNLQVVAVVTAPDRPSGRGRSLKASPVKEYAQSHNLPVLQPENLKSEAFLEQLKKIAPDLQIVVAFRMLPKQVWAMPRFGTFNLHASLLPQYRGAAPINWAIINGEKQTGITTFFIDEKIDTGQIIMNRKIPILKTDNAGSLHDKLMEEGKKLVLETVQAIAENRVQPIAQQEFEKLKPAPKLTSENTRINWNEPAKQIHNTIRGLSPYPGAWAILVQNEKEIPVKIFESSFQTTNHPYKTGAVLVDKNTLKVAVNKGYVELLQIQLPGKKRMDVQSLLNGYKIPSTSKFL